MSMKISATSFSPPLMGDDRQDVLVSNAGRKPKLRLTMSHSDRGGGKKDKKPEKNLMTYT